MPSTADSPGTVSYIRTLPENECFELLTDGHRRSSRIHIAHRVADHPHELPPRPRSPILHEDSAWQPRWHSWQRSMPRLPSKLTITQTVARSPGRADERHDQSTGCCGDDSIRGAPSATRSVGRVDSFPCASSRGQYPVVVYTALAD